MSWRFRKSFSPIPGVRVTLSPSGLSTSVGAGPFRVTVGPSGSALTTRVPGTGIAFRQALGGPGGAAPSGSSPGSRGVFSPAEAPPLDDPAPIPAVPATALPPMQEIKSAGSGLLTTPGLEAFKRVLEQAGKEHALIVRDLKDARRDEIHAATKWRSWEDGWLLKRLFAAKFVAMKATADETVERRRELEEQEALAKLQAQFEVPEGVKRSFHAMRDEFDKMSRSQKVWDTVSHRDANRVAERTTASRVVERKPVSFRVGRCELIDFEVSVPHMENANGGDLYLYPAFVLYFVSASSFALIEYADINLSASPARFVEEEQVPSDAEVVGRAWAKANKDGSPDRRFTDNHQIPVALYGKLEIRSSSGVQEEYLVSNQKQADEFARSWLAHVKAVTECS